MRISADLAVSFALALVGLTPVSFAGSESSGGGNAVICFSDLETATRVAETHRVEDSDLGTITSIELLDLVEAKKQATLSGGKVFEWSPSVSTPEELFKAVQTRLDFIAPESVFSNGGTISQARRAMELLPKGKEAFVSAKYPVAGTIQKPLPYSADAGTTDPLPKGCALVTILRHQDKLDIERPQGSWVGDLYLPMPPVAFHSSSYELDTRLFFHPAHSLLSQSLGFMHEYYFVGLKDTNEQGQSVLSDSKPVRRLLSLLIIEQPDLSSKQAFQELRDIAKDTPSVMSRLETYVQYSSRYTWVREYLHSELNRLWDLNVFKPLKVEIERVNAVLARYRVRRAFWASAFNTTAKPTHEVPQKCDVSSASSLAFSWDDCMLAYRIFADGSWRRFDNFRRTNPAGGREKFEQLAKDRAEAKKNIAKIKKLILDGITQIQPPLISFFERNHEGDLRKHLEDLKMDPRGIESTMTHFKDAVRAALADIRKSREKSDVTPKMPDLHYSRNFTYFLEMQDRFAIPTQDEFPITIPSLDEGLKLIKKPQQQ